jgi:hypothetical protein
VLCRWHGDGRAELAASCDPRSGNVYVRRQCTRFQRGRRLSSAQTSHAATVRARPRSVQGASRFGRSNVLTRVTNPD